MFYIKLSAKTNPKEVDLSEYLNREYDPDLDNITSILSDITDILFETESVNFDIGGFGQTFWGVSVYLDLLIFLENLPDFLAWLNFSQNKPFRLNFFEQGTQRLLTFTKSDSNFIEISCFSRTEWQPSPETELIERTVLENMLSTFIKVFVEQLKYIPSKTTQHLWFQNWLTSIYTQK